MFLFPAIDLKNNKCVRLKKGEEASSIVFNENPVDQAIYFEQSGCKRLHIVDLDSAFGNDKTNTKTIIDIRKAVTIPIQIGGGIKNEDDIKKYIDQGINYLIVGSFSISNSEKVMELSQLYKDKIYIALDVLENKIMIRGWTKKTNYETIDIFNKYNKSKIRGFILTDVSRDGMLNGLNMKMINQNLKLTKKKLIVGGGLKSYDDLRNLKQINDINLEGVIAGKSYYVGNIQIKKALEILN